MTELSRRDVLGSTGALMLAGALCESASSRARAGEHSSTMRSFALDEIAAAAGATGRRSPRVEMRIDPALGAQAYRVMRSSDGLLVKAGDEAGAMYGGLDIAEALRLGPGAMSRVLEPRTRSPRVLQRGIKFNIPLDLRTPGYGDASTSARLNIPEMWTQPFWANLFDEMARHRYNAISLWNLHPFPSLVKVPEFPDVALDDVWRTTRPIDTVPLQHSGRSAVTPEMLAQHEVVRRMTIDDKIAFWRKVMEMGAARGIGVYIVTWNVFTWGTQGKYGIDDRMTNPITRAYLRASVKALVETYPLLKGIGLTAGENMVPQPGIAKEPWLWATYGEGVHDALAKQPARDFRLIHRFWQTSGEEIRRNWAKPPLWPDRFEFSFKYSWAHLYSDPKPRFVDTVMPLLKETGLKTWLEIRNDDMFGLRWGDPAFTRTYVENLPARDRVEGFFMGPDGFIWGRDFLDRDADGKDLGPARQLVMRKHWYSFMLWGRLSFDPGLPDDHFISAFRSRFPRADAPRLFEATQLASRIIPQTTRFFWRDEDLNWLPEACAGWDDSRGSELWSVAGFMAGVTMPNSAILNIRQWRHRLLNGLPMQAKTPLEVADNLDSLSARTLRLVGELRGRPTNLATKELRETVGDNEAMAHLGAYYAAKIRGASELALFDGSGDEAARQRAIGHLEQALAAWKLYAGIYSSQYVPNFYARIGWIDLTALASEVAMDIQIARHWISGRLPFDPANAADQQIGDSARTVS